MVDNERLRQLQEAEAACEADAIAAAKAVAYRNELRHRLEIQASLTLLGFCLHIAGLTGPSVEECLDQDDRPALYS